MKKIYTYGFMILGAIFLYYGYLMEDSLEYSKFIPSIIIGGILFIFGLVKS